VAKAAIEVVAEAASRCRELSFTPVSDLLSEGIQPISWLVRGYIESDSVALLFGDPASGKSFVAIDLACCIATGTPWHECPVTQGAVFYIAGEGMNGLKRRFMAWKIKNGSDLGELYLGNHAVQLCTAKAAAEVANAIDQIAEFNGVTPRLIVIDTLARNFGGDENSTEDMNAFIANVDAFLRDKYQATVLVVHHTGHADKSRARGSMALKGALDAEYRVVRDESTVCFEATKMKEAPDPDSVAFRMCEVELLAADDANEPVTSVVLQRLSEVPQAAKPGKAGRGKNQTKALNCLRELFDTSRRRAVASGRSAECGRVTLDVWRGRLQEIGLNRFQIRDAIQSLENAGVISKEIGGHVHLADECPL